MNRLCLLLLFALTLVFGGTNLVRADQAGNLRFDFGTYTSDASPGIYVSPLDPATGKRLPAELAAVALQWQD